jgi:hypothetical protein
MTEEHPLKKSLGPTLTVRVDSISNPYCWYRASVGETFEAAWFDIWGCYLVIDRLGRHPDDMKLREKDVSVVSL